MSCNKSVDKINSIEFIRAICAIGIIVYHISCRTSPDTPKYLYASANGLYGSILVNVFFLVSGGVLYYNYKSIPSVKLFLFKRWKSIFPMFYLIWLYKYSGLVLHHGGLFYNGNPITLLFTLFGLDGYLAYKFPTYYIIGEWFMGAILMLYIIYPILLKLVHRFQWKILLFSIPIWIWELNTDIFDIFVSRNLIYCTCIFLLGMLIFKYELYKKKSALISGLFASAILLFVPIPGNVIYTEIFVSISLFFALLGIGSVVMKVPALHSVFSLLGRLSYPIFLVHHFILIDMVNCWQPITTSSTLLVIMVSILQSIAYAWCFDAIIHALTKTVWFRRLENFFISDKSSAAKE